jgi:hypothetical protein
VAEAVTALWVGYNQQLAVRGDVDPEPVVDAVVAVVEPSGRMAP